MNIIVSKPLNKLALALTLTSSLTLGACVLNDDLDPYYSNNFSNSYSYGAESQTTTDLGNGTRSTSSSVKRSTSTSHNSYSSSTSSTSSSFGISSDPLNKLLLELLASPNNPINAKELLGNTSSNKDANSDALKKEKASITNGAYSYRKKYPEVFLGKSTLAPLQRNHLDQIYNYYPFPGKNPLYNSDLDIYENDGKNPRAFKYPFPPVINYNQIQGDFVFKAFYDEKDQIVVNSRNLIGYGNNESLFLQKNIAQRLLKNSNNYVNFDTDTEQLENLCWVNSYIFNGQSLNSKFNVEDVLKRYVKLYQTKNFFVDVKLTTKIVESMMARYLSNQEGSMASSKYPLAFRTEDFRGLKVLQHEDGFVTLSTPDRQFVFKLSTNGRNEMHDVDLTKPLEFIVKDAYLKAADKNNLSCVMTAVINQK